MSNKPKHSSLSNELFQKKRSRLYPPTQASPHLRSPGPTNQTIMADVLIALLPAIFGSVYFFGFTVLPLYAISIVCAVATTCAVQAIRRQKLFLDISCVVSAVLLSMSLPATAPLWFPALGIVFGLLAGRELFGGLGQNFLNPALTGRALLRIAFAQQVLQNPLPNPPFNMLPPVDGVAGATPLMVIKEGQSLTTGELWQSFIGNVPGKLGETSAFLLLIGAVYLIARRVISPRIPLTMLGTIAVIAFVFSGSNGLFSANYTIVLGHLLGGASILGAFYMATDYGSSPSAPSAQIIYAVFLGINIMLWRLFSPYSEGFTFAILTANLVVPLLNRYMRPRVLGENRWYRRNRAAGS